MPGSKAYKRHRCAKLLTELPKDGENILTFKNHNNKLKVPFAIYADFESILEPVFGREHETRRAKHIPVSIVLMMIA